MSSDTDEAMMAAVWSETPVFLSQALAKEIVIVQSSSYPVYFPVLVDEVYSET